MSWLYRARSLLVLPGESVDSCEMREGGTGGEAKRGIGKDWRRSEATAREG